MSQVISDLSKIELVSIFNRYIKEFFLFLLQKIFVNTTTLTVLLVINCKWGPFIKNK